MKTIKPNERKKLYALHARAYDLFAKVEAQAKWEKTRHARQVSGHEKK